MGPRDGLGDVCTININYFFCGWGVGEGINIILFQINAVAI